MNDKLPKKASDVKEAKIPNSKFEQWREKIQAMNLTPYGLRDHEELLYKHLKKNISPHNSLTEYQARKIIHAYKSEIYDEDTNPAVRRALFGWIIVKLGDDASPNFEKQMLYRYFQAAYDCKKFEKKETTGQGLSPDPAMLTQKGLNVSPSLLIGPGEIKVSVLQTSDYLFPEGTELVPGGKPDAIQLMMLKTLQKTLLQPLVDKQTYAGLIEKEILGALIFAVKNVIRKIMSKLSAKNLKKIADEGPLELIRIFNNFENTVNDIIRTRTVVNMFKDFAKRSIFGVPNTFKSTLVPVIDEMQLDELNRIMGRKTAKATASTKEFGLVDLKKTLNLQENYKKFFQKNKKFLFSDFWKTYSSILKIGSSVMDLAGRDPEKIRRYRRKQQPESFALNKAFLLVLMEHKKVTDKFNKDTTPVQDMNRQLGQPPRPMEIQKYALETVAQIVLNIKDDNELRQRIHDLKPALIYLGVYTKLGDLIAKSTEDKAKWKKASEDEKKKYVTKEIFDFLFPAEDLKLSDYKNKKKKFINDRMLALRKIIDGEMQEYTIKRKPPLPSNPEVTQMLVSLSLLIDNLRIQVVKSSGDTKKIIALLKKIIAIIRTIKKSIKVSDRYDLESKDSIVAKLFKRPADFADLVKSMRIVTQHNIRGIEVFKDFGVDLYKQRGLLKKETKIKGVIPVYARILRTLLAKLRKEKKTTNSPKKIKEYDESIKKIRLLMVQKTFELKNVEDTKSKYKSFGALIKNATNKKTLRSAIEIVFGSLKEKLPRRIQYFADPRIVTDILFKENRSPVLKAANSLVTTLMNKSALKTIFREKVPQLAMVFRVMLLKRIMKKPPRTQKQLENLVYKCLVDSLSHTKFINSFVNKKDMLYVKVYDERISAQERNSTRKEIKHNIRTSINWAKFSRS